MRDWLLRIADPPAFRALMRRLWTRDLRAALRWCLPAALLAVLLRAVLLACMPAAFVHNDTASLVETADRLVTHGAFEIEGKKTFLAPVLYSIPAVLRLPILPFVAILQHLLGVLAVFLSGLLVFAWFRHWRVFIVPATVFVAVDPVLIWYEHAALAESLAVFGILLVAAAATLFYRFPGRHSFAALLLAVLVMAGARPEGRLFALFAVALAARVLWGNWRAFRVGVPVAILWTAVLFSFTRTNQSGLLLFTSVLHLTPDHLVFSPGIAEAVSPLRVEARESWQRADPPKLVAMRKQLQRALIAAQVAEGVPEKAAAKKVEAIARRAGLESALRRPDAMVPLAIRKFVIAHRELPCSDFNAYAIDGQLDALIDDSSDDESLRYAKLLWGRDLATPEAARAFLAAEYRPLPGDFLTRMLHGFHNFCLLPLAPISLPGSEAGRVALHGLPWLYTTALAGLICLAFRDRRSLNFHQLWGAFLVGLFVLIMVTANIRARFRILFEPFWILYALALADTLLIGLQRWLPRRRRLPSA